MSGVATGCLYVDGGHRLYVGGGHRLTVCQG